MEGFNYEMKPILKIQDGTHTGAIVGIERREVLYQSKILRYVDISIGIDGLENIILRYGCPENMNLQSKLGRLVRQFREIPVGEKFDLEALLVGKKVNFMTLNQPAKDGKGSFARIVEDSLHPIL